MAIKIQNLILEINSVCNNKCIYCYLPKLADRQKINSNDYFKKNLLKFRKKNVESVDFTGGEPTLSDSLFELVKFAKDSGYRNRTLVTNGRMLAYEKYCQKILDSGINAVVLSFDGPNEKIADAVTGVQGSFRQVVKAIKNIKRLSSIEIGATIVVNKISYKYIPETVRKLISLDVDFINIQFILPYIRDKKVPCRRLPSQVISSYRQSVPYIAKALEKYGSLIDIRVHFIPFCCMEGFEKYLLKEAVKLDRYVLNYMGFGYNIGEHLQEGALKTKKCKNCNYNDKCVGFFYSYSKELGIEI